MQMEIKARHFTLKDDQREIVEAALEKLEKFIPRPVQSFKIYLDHDAGQFVADAVLHLKHHEFRATGQGEEPEYAVNELVESLKKQLTRFKGRLDDHKKGEEGGLGRVSLEGEIALGDEEETEGLLLPDLDVDEARARFNGGTLPFLVFRNAANARLGVIYRRADGALGHMESDQD